MWWLCLLAGVTANLVPNDFCTGAITVQAGSGTGTNVGALEQRQVDDLYGDDVWYKYVATTTGWATFSATSSIRIGIAVFYGSSCAKLGLYGQPANRSSYSSCDSSTDVTWPIFSGSTYYLAVGSYNCGEGASFSWSLSTATDASPTAGDSCRAPINVGVSGLDSHSIDGATKQDYSFYGESDIFWAWNATCTGMATVTATSQFSNVLAAYFSQSCDDIIGLDNVLTYDSGGNSSITFPVWAGHTYLVAGGPYYTGCTGNIDVAFTCMAQATASNDVCNTAIAATTGFTTSTTNANTNFNDNLCYYNAPQSDVWVSTTASCTGTLNLNINSTNVAFLRGSSCDTAQVLYCGYGTDHAIDVQMNDNLYIALGYYSGYDNIVGTLTCTPYNVQPNANSRCAGASPVTGTPQTFPTANAITDALSNRPTYTQGGWSCNNLFFSTFFSYTATCTGSATVNANSTTTNNLGFALYQESACSANVEPAYCQNDFTYSGAGSLGPFNVNAGDVWTFGVSYYDSNAPRSNIIVSVDCNGVGVTSAPTNGGSSQPTIAFTATPTIAFTATPTSSSAPSTSSSAAPTVSHAPTASSAPTVSSAPTSPTTMGSNSSTAPTTMSTTTNGAAFMGFGFATVFGFLLL